jgi:hypothetical protein
MVSSYEAADFVWLTSDQGAAVELLGIPIPNAMIRRHRFV